MDFSGADRYNEYRQMLESKLSFNDEDLGEENTVRISQRRGKSICPRERVKMYNDSVLTKRRLISKKLYEKRLKQKEQEH